MSRDDARKLLGGYATGTLTAEEQRALFEAALEDQELFDWLVREQALRDLLGDPAARAQLLAAVDGTSAPWYRRWWRPVPVAVLATALTALMAVVAIVAVRQSSRPARRRVTMARVVMPPPVASPAPILPPPPEMAPAKPMLLAPLQLPGVAPADAPPPPEPTVRVMARAPMFTRAAPASGDLRPGQVPAQPRAAAPRAGPAAAANGFLVNGSTIPGLAPAFFPVHGTVTDAAGAAVPSANVEVKSVATGEVFRTDTNERGEFNAPVPPGGAYQISASARGFRTAAVSGVTPASGMPEPVNLRLEVGAAAESVEVSTTAGPIAVAAPPPPAPAMAGGGAGGAGGALAGGFGGLGAATATGSLDATRPPTHPGLQYHILRSVPGGGRVEVGAEGNVPAGASVILEVTPDADGYLRIARAGGHAIANRAVRRMQPVETQLPKFRKPARVEFRVSFSRQPWNAKTPEPAGAESVAITLNFQ
jgi:hypothetical protein